MRHVALSLVLVLAGTAFAQDTAAVASRTVERTLDVDGGRTYRLHLPARGATEKERLPLVLVLHGAGGTGAIQEGMSGFDEIADEKHFAACYPDGRHRLWQYTEESPDVTFLVAIVDALVKEGTADSRRVYVCGISNGAYMTNRLLLDHADRFAAGGAVAGTLPKLVAKKEKPARAVSFIYFHGTDDRIVGYDGKDFISRHALSLPAEDLVSWWVDKDGCAKDPKVDELPRKDEDTSVTRSVYGQGKDGAEVVFYKVEGGGHTWPGGRMQPRALLGKTTRAVNASRVMWEFFANHVLPEKK